MRVGYTKSGDASLSVFCISTGRNQSACGYSISSYTYLFRAQPRNPSGTAATTAHGAEVSSLSFQAGTNNKTADVRIRFTPDEKAKAKAFAEEASLTLSEYIRRRATGMPVRSKADAQMINELRRLGGLVKHIHNQTAGLYNNETADMLVQITEAIKRVGSLEHDS